jgi:alpha-tubulin suppressor-like RCC1 family protein
VVVLLALTLYVVPTTQAQDLYVTNLNQLVAEAYSTDHSVYLPFSPWDWRAYSLDGSEPWWLDCSQVSCDALFQTPVELSVGVPAYTVVLIQNVLTGETTVQPDGSSGVVATVAAPSGYQPVMTSWNRWLWNWYEQVIDQPDVWGLSAGEIPPPTITLKALLADMSNYATYAAYQSNLEAEAEAAQAAQVMVASMNSRFMPMDDDGGDGGDPCTLTNLLQSFAATTIARGTNGAMTITWQSCQFFRYLVFSAKVMSTNMQWVPQAYVWGSNGASVTSWTDLSTTNNDGNTITQRFYRVQRLLGSPIAAGSDFSVVVRQDGKLWAWGDNGGELGDGLGGVVANGNAVEAYLPYPGEVANVIPCTGQAVTNAVALAAGGDDFTIVADANGVVWTFGEVDGGQLGNGAGPCYGDCPPPTATPTPVTGVNNVVAVAAGYQHALALRSDGKVFAWGNDEDQEFNGNQDGQLGLGVLPCCPYATNLPAQTEFPTGVVIVAVAAGYRHSVALDSGGNVWTFGDNEYGQLGNGTSGYCGDSDGVTTPTMLTNIANVIAIAAGDTHTIALTADKTVWTWGSSGNGRLGYSVGGCEDCCVAPSPGQIPPSILSNVVTIAGGENFSVAVTANGRVYGWGDNEYGQLATNGPSELDIPTLLPGISNVVWISAPRSNDACDGPAIGGHHCLAMTLDQGTNHYVAWGDNTYGQIGNATTGGTGTNVTGCGAFTYVSAPTQPQFCTRCQRTVQLGTNGSFTAQCNGALYLYFNTDNFGACTGQYNVTFGSLVTNVPANASTGVAVGTVTQGSNYSFHASGYCTYDFVGHQADPSGNPPSGPPADCSNSLVINITNAPCPTATCFSLVGRIQ